MPISRAYRCPRPERGRIAVCLTVLIYKTCVAVFSPRCESPAATRVAAADEEGTVRSHDGRHFCAEAAEPEKAPHGSMLPGKPADFGSGSGCAYLPQAMGRSVLSRRMAALGEKTGVTRHRPNPSRGPTFIQSSSWERVVSASRATYSLTSCSQTWRVV